MFKILAMVTVFAFLDVTYANARQEKNEFYQKVEIALKTLNLISTYKQYSDSLTYLKSKAEQGSRYPCPGYFMINPQDYSAIFKMNVNSLPPLAKAIVVACGTMNLENEKIPSDILTKVKDAQDELEKETQRLTAEFNNLGPL